VEGRDRRDWQELAELDPYWAALTEDAKRSGGWDETEFVRSGAGEVGFLLAHAGAIGRPARREAALDFGCGPGRLTRALAAHFGHVVGIDISERMIETARALNGDVGNCRFEAGGAALGRFDDRSFDLVYSNLVLQHVSDRRAALAYVSELARVLAPEGLLVIQIPSHIPPLRRLQPRRRLYKALRRVGVPPGFLFYRLRLDPVSLHALPTGAVTHALERPGARVLRVDEEPWHGGIRSATYFATR
jgi:SAM-dependent methyltransferase